MRLTKIICTLGPASESKEQIASLAHAGMNIARLNLSHGSAPDHRAMVRMLKEMNAKGSCIAIMIDIKGPEIRTNDVAQPLTVERGQEMLQGLPAPLRICADAPVSQIHHVADEAEATGHLGCEVSKAHTMHPTDHP